MKQLREEVELDEQTENIIHNLAQGKKSDVEQT